MKTRLRYTKSNLENIYTVTELISNKHNDVLTVTLDTRALSATITKSTGELLVTLTGSSLAQVKKNTKKALAVEGVVFLDELRKREPKSTEQAA